MNGVVDYYEICTFVLDRCEPKLSMLASPIEARKFGQDYHLGMVKLFIKIPDIRCRELLLNEMRIETKQVILKKRLFK